MTSKKPAQKLSVERISIEALIPYARNARTHSDAQVAQLVRSIREFGFTNPVLIAEDNTIIAGHGRVLAARELELTDVPCLRLSHLTEAQRRAYIIADNQLALNAGWDDEVLAAELAALEADNFNLDLIGFAPGELSRLLTLDTDSADADDIDDSAPSAPVAPVCQSGDVWRLGAHRLLCGDATKSADIAALMGEDIADLAILDPPYNVDYTGKTSDALKISGDAMASEEFREFLKCAFSNMANALKPGGGSTFFIAIPKVRIFGRLCARRD